MKKELDEIIKKFEETKFVKEGGSAFECSDYEIMYEELIDFISTTYPAYAKEFAESCVPEERIPKFKIGNPVEYAQETLYAIGFNSAIFAMRENINKEIK